MLHRAVARELDEFGDRVRIQRLGPVPGIEVTLVARDREAACSCLEIDHIRLQLVGSRNHLL